MVKRKFKQIEKNSEKAVRVRREATKNRGLVQEQTQIGWSPWLKKKVKAIRFHKTNVRNKEALNKLKFNDDSPEEKILSNHSGSEASETLFIDTKASKKVERNKTKIYNEKIFLRKRKMLFFSEILCSSDLSYHQSFSTSLLDLFKLGKIQGDGNCLFWVLCN